jgi:putative membrane protein
MKTLKFIGLMMIAACTFQACEKDDNEDDIDKGEEAEFVTKASASNQFEIQAGQLAVVKGMSAQVKAYGAHMIVDHTQANQELATLASQNGLTISTGLTEEQTTMYNTLSQQSGANFDRAYAEMMVNSHQRTVNMFSEAAEDAFAFGKLPVLRAHLEEAIQLRANVQ